MTKPLHRRKLPAERASITHKFVVGGLRGYIIVGLYEDGTPGEVFLRLGKAGAMMGEMMSAFAIAISISLQHGVPLEAICEQFTGVKFKPDGLTSNPQIIEVSSVIDYIFRWLTLRFPPSAPKDITP